MKKYILTLLSLYYFTVQAQEKEVVSEDSFNLAILKVKKSIDEDGKSIDSTLLSEGIFELKKSVDINIDLASKLNELGKNYYETKLYKVAISIFEIAISYKNSKNYLIDNMFYGSSVLKEIKEADAKLIDKIVLAKADKSMDNVIALKPNYQEAYLYKARINSILEKNDVMAIMYQQFLDLFYTKNQEEILKAKSKIIEAYNNLAAYYANSDKAKAIELFNKTMALDPNNTYAIDSLKRLNK